MDVKICPDDHKHDETGTCHSAHGCRCVPCVQAHTNYSFYWRHMTIAERPLNSDVDGRGTRRRIQALHALGWSARAIGEHVNRDQTVVSRWALAARVTRATAKMIADVYDLLSDAAPPTNTHGERISRARTLARARREGFALPIEWDDIDEDDAPHRPEADADEIDVVAVQLVVSDGARVTLNRTERREAVRQLHARYLNDRQISELLGVNEKTVLFDRQALELGPAVSHDRRPILRGRAA